MRFISIFLFFLSITLAAESQGKKVLFTFKASQKNILQGDSTILNWNVTKAYRVMMPAVGDSNLPLIGSRIVNPNKSTEYILYVKLKDNDEASLKKRLLVNVNSPIIKSFVLPDSTNDETPVTLSWASEFTDSIFISGFDSIFDSRGSILVNPDTTSTYTLLIKNRNGYSQTKSLTIKVGLVESFKGTASIQAGDKAKITWKFKRTKYVTINNGDSLYRAHDSLTAKLDSTTTYKIRAYRNGGLVEEHKHTINATRPYIVYFKANSVIMKGDKAVLSWKVVGLNSIVKIKGIEKTFSAQGSYTVFPDTTTRYELTATASGFELNAKTDINVIERSFIRGNKHLSMVRPGQRLDFEIFATDRSKFPAEMKIYVLATDTAGYFISGLVPDSGINKPNKYFKRIVEDVEGNNSEIKQFKVKEIFRNQDSIDFVLVLDYSGSMYGRSIRKLEEACSTFIDRKNSGDRVTIVKFDNRLVVESKLIADKELLKQRFALTPFDSMAGATALYAANDIGLNCIDTSSKNPKIFIMFTDGFENSSMQYYGSRATTPFEVVSRARKMGVSFRVVSLGNNVNKTLLQFMSVLTDGNYYRVLNPNRLDRLFEDILITSRRFYEISYQPAYTNNDQQHNIKLTVNNNIQDVTAAKSFYVGDKYNIIEMEFDAYKGLAWYDSLKVKYRTLQPLHAPQRVANFDLNKSDLDTSDKTIILKYVDFLNAQPNTKALILGHTDLQGNDFACDTLSKNRAMIVKMYMLKRGIAKDRLLIEGIGKRSPMWPDEVNEYQAAENRRAEIVMLKTGK